MHVEIYPRKYFVADSSKSTHPHESGLVAFSTAKTSVCIAGGLYSLRFHKFTILGTRFRGICIPCGRKAYPQQNDCG